jgi:hypothetical protein
LEVFAAELIFVENLHLLEAADKIVDLAVFVRVVFDMTADLEVSVVERAFVKHFADYLVDSEQPAYLVVAQAVEDVAKLVVVE